MVDNFVIESIKRDLGCTELDFVRVDWIWTTGTTFIINLDIDKANDIDGILIFNFGITMNGSGVLVNITDLKIAGRVLYQNTNLFRHSIVAPFVYWSRGNTLKISAISGITFGFNYVTIRKRK